MYKIELDVVKAFLCDGLSHREIQKWILKKDAPVRGGGFLAMNILHRFGIREQHKNILRGKPFDEHLFSSKRSINAYLAVINSANSTVEGDKKGEASYDVSKLVTYNSRGYDINEFDYDGFDRERYNRAGFDVDGYNRGGYNGSGYNRHGVHREKG